MYLGNEIWRFGREELEVVVRWELKVPRSWFRRAA
jgi:hypothetical protein